MFTTHEAAEAAFDLREETIARMVADGDRKLLCQWTDTGYPHPGAAEFGEPDVFFCEADGEFLIWQDDEPFTHPEDGLSCDALRFCARHAAQALAHNLVEMQHPYSTPIIRVEQMPPFVVRCVTGHTVRFASMRAAKNYEWWGHLCLAEHDIFRVGAPVVSL